MELDKFGAYILGIIGIGILLGAVFTQPIPDKTDRLEENDCVVHKLDPTKIGIVTWASLKGDRAHVRFEAFDHAIGYNAPELTKVNCNKGE